MADGAGVAHEGPAKPHDYSMAKLGMWLFLGSEVMFFTGFIAAYIVLRSSNAMAEDQSHLDWKLAAVNTLVLICSSLTMALAVGSAQRSDTRGVRLFLGLTLVFGLVFLGIKGVEWGAKLGKTGVVAVVDEEGEEREAFLDEAEHQEKIGRPWVLVDPIQVENDEGDLVTLPAGTAVTSTVAEQIVDTTDDDDNLINRELHVKMPIGPHSSVFYSCYYMLTGFHGLHVVAGLIALGILFGCAGKFSSAWFTPVEMTGLYWHFVDVVWIFLFPVFYLI